MAIESKNLLVWVKAMSRGQALPLDASEIHSTLAEARTYAASAIAYEGQTIKAKLEDGKYHEYIIQPSESGYILEEVGAISPGDLKQYVVIDDKLPSSGQEQGILYINTADNTGSIWTGSEYKLVFSEVSARVDALEEAVDELEGAVDKKAPLENPVFSGVVKVGDDEVALKPYVESLIANLKNTTVPGVVDSKTPIPENYKAGASYRVAEAGTYAGVKCEAGDLILVLKDYNADTASNSDFIVLQSNIDGAVTSSADVTTVGEIVVFDSVTGKVIKGAGIQLDSLNAAMAKAHEHANLDVLNSYDKTQTDLLNAAKEEASGLVTALDNRLTGEIDKKASKGTTLADYGITDAYTKTEENTYRSTLEQNLNSKISAADVDEKIAAAKEETLESAAEAASVAFEARVGAIPADTTVKSYIDTAVGSGGTASAEAIATAKQEAIDTSKGYTDTKITEALTVVEF